MGTNNWFITFYFLQWKANFPQLKSALITILVTCNYESGWKDYYLRAKVPGTWSKQGTNCSEHAQDCVNVLHAFHQITEVLQL